MTLAPIDTAPAAPGTTASVAAALRERDVSAFVSHVIGAVGTLAASIVLLVLGHASAWHIVGFAVFGATTTTLYIASSLYHILPHHPTDATRLLKFDHIAIYLMIAGGYTPVCLLALEGAVGWALLAAIWSVFVIGAVLKMFWFQPMARVSTMLYVLMGWMSVLAVVPLYRGLGAEGFLWLLGGGILYTIGAIIYHFERPDPWPRIMGHHEIFHLFILGGTVCHFVLMFGTMRHLPA